MKKTPFQIDPHGRLHNHLLHDDRHYGCCLERPLLTVGMAQLELVQMTEYLGYLGPARR